MPAEGVVNALRRIHAALGPGGIVVDTQPLSPEPPLEADGHDLGRLDMREWARTISAVDDRVAQAVEDGLFSIEDERRFVVTDRYDDGPECLDVVRGWAGTSVDKRLAERLMDERSPVSVHQEVRLRLLRAL